MARLSYPAVLGMRGDRPTVDFIDFPGNKVSFSAEDDPVEFAKRRLLAVLAVTVATQRTPPQATPFLKVKPAEGEEVKLIAVEWGQ